MNLFQARPGRRVLFLMVARHVETGEPIWFPAVVVSRDFFRGVAVVDLDDGLSVRTLVSVGCDEDFKLPRLRLAREGDAQC